jgi:hypothetical protein
VRNPTQSLLGSECVYGVDSVRFNLEKAKSEPVSGLHSRGLVPMP